MGTGAGSMIPDRVQFFVLTAFCILRCPVVSIPEIQENGTGGQGMGAPSSAGGRHEEDDR